ncbi:MAG: class II aldolase/adducin family protein [Gammaproteobacteria bacterium]
MNTFSNEQEGVIKYLLHHHPAILDANIDITEINAWRSVLQRLGLIGQNPLKYGGLGYGNISRRLQHPFGGFLVSGTQTGHLVHLTRADYCIVRHAEPRNNTLEAVGPCQPSSEALTHAVVYRQLAGVQCVIHVHCPEIWQHATDLQLAATAADIPYGTPEMAAAVEQLLAVPHCLQRRLFIMRGHQDGVVSYGNDIQEAAQSLIACLAKAIAIAGEGITG